jgi:hypothetical protein
MGVLPALFLDVTTFARTHGIGRRRLLALMDAGIIPELSSGGGSNKRYINLVELLERIQADQFDMSELRESKTRKTK